MLKILSYGAAFAAGAIVANSEVRQGIQVTASDSLHSVAEFVRPTEYKNDGVPMGEGYGKR